MNSEMNIEMAEWGRGEKKKREGRIAKTKIIIIIAEG